ncbi:uncharacterized protein LOC122856357 [Aphidius gifuensis]|uniref:uncharacterized protein LOC122856357 n=1 Tax=Aphidius gifuensis TaxID=684658 RepID=UPI001CDB6145|nr:uncharacterized protein LOC122856357 [Aphidius gifuensis]
MTEFKRDIVRELHASTRRNFPRRKVDIRDKDETWQADLVDMIEHSSFSWAVELKSKTEKEVSAAMESIFKKGRVCKNLHVDQKKYNVHMYSTFTHMKASIVERFNRTIKNKLYFEFSLQGTYKWVKILPKLIEQYNNTKHRTIKMAPAKVVEKL